MSSDLLAEFDSFYKAPQADTSSNTNTSNAFNTATSNNFSFFDPPSSTSNVPQSTQSQWNAPTSTNDDIWGDFNALQIGSSQQTAAPAVADPWGSFEMPVHDVPASSGYNNGNKPNLGFGATRATKQQSSNNTPKIQRERSSTLDIFSGNIGASASKPRASQPAKYPTYQIPDISQEPDVKPGDILFDADEEFGDEDDDDFGDFETVAEPALPAPAPDLLTMVDSPAKTKVQKRPEPVTTKSSSLVVNQFPYPQAPKSPSFQERNPFEKLAIKTPTTAEPEKLENFFQGTDSPVTAWPSFEPAVPKPAPYVDSPAVKDSPDEDWGDFADLPPDPSSTKPSTGIEADAWAWDSVDGVNSAPKAKEVDAPPPTNLPPPSVLMGLFPQLLNLPQPALFKPVSMQTQPLKNRILSDPATVTFLRSYLALVTVCAHIIAGRKLRWKRDTILAQAMKIGPSAAGGKGGMKLTGVDKAEVTREEREAADVVRIWQDQLGRLRSAIAGANANLQNKGELLFVPDIGENMSVKAVTMAEGGLTAPKCCVLCGLKREERVAKVDVKVEDSFGEWWVEHWGHRMCRNFWEEHESKLRGR